jgi:hypothetical protein
VNVGARLVLGLTAGAVAGSIALVVSTRDDLVKNGIPLTVPLAGEIRIKPQINADPSTAATAAGVALVVAFVAFLVASA